jgi:glycosyltransferase involved in cell wall biosynthesis
VATRPDDRPRFSFLTTAYRTEAYLGATIESVIAQSDANWGLVVVDNGNDDDIAALVAGFDHDPRITLLRQENKGYVGGVMASAAEAHGHFLCVLDSDD